MPTYPITLQLFSFCDILTDFSSLLLPRIVGFNGVGLYRFEVWLRWLNTVLAVCDYMSFAKSWQEKVCCSQAETWQVKNVLINILIDR